jgi:uncharacterized protein with PIN domain
VTSVLHVVDSSGWIEVFTNGPQADRFLEVLDDETSLIVPAITVFEVFKWILREHSEATARQHQARLFSMDADFKGLADVELILKVC